MLSPIIKKKIETKFGSSIRYPKDCDALARSISEVCKTKISGSTIKRLFGLITGTHAPRQYTLDLIALYLDYASFDNLLNHLVDNEPKREKRIDQVNSNNLKKGEILRLNFGKKITLTIEYYETGQFIVRHQSDTVLFENDILEIEKIQLHFPLLIKRLVRNKEILDGLMIGTVTGVTDINEIENERKIIASKTSQLNSIN